MKVAVAVEAAAVVAAVEVAAVVVGSTDLRC